MEIYVVQPGDTLYSIAQKYGVSVASLQSLNGVSNPDQLVVGQAIVIPGPQLTPLRYQVVAGDTLYLLSQLFGVGVTAIAQVNNITNPERIGVGMVLTIPGWSQVDYRINPGDTLYQIAGRFGVPVSLIAKVNRITNPSLIFPGQVLVIPQRNPAKPVKEVMGYFQTTGLAGLGRSLAVIGSYITYASIFQFPVGPDGSIAAPSVTGDMINMFKNYRIRPLLVITNWGATGFESDLARTILSNPAIKAQTIGNLLNLLDRFGFAGVNVDFENMYPEDRPLYTGFIQDIANALKPKNYLVTVAVAPKYADFPNQPWVGAFDYAALGRIADIIFLMTYEWGWIGGPPMAIAPINLVRRTLTYATSQIPPSKILQGVPLYGYDWPLPHTPEKLAAPVNLVEVYSIAARYGAVIQYDQTAQSPFFDYRDEAGVDHEVWFEDARSVRAKYEAARDFGLRGVGYWSYVNEPYGFPQNWAILSDMFTIVK